MNIRRLPVYLVLDCSESMAGPAIEAVNTGVTALVKEVQGNPNALETVFLSVITFSRYAKQLIPLTEAFRFVAPKLSVRPGTALGSALMLLKDRLEKEVVKTTATSKGDYRPLVFLMTDGQPTDNWESAADAFKQMRHPKIASVYAIGCGPDVETKVLRRITDIVLKMPDMSPESIKKFFVWLSASIQTVSQKAGGENISDQGPIDIKSLPPELMELVTERDDQRVDENLGIGPRQVFLHAKCGKVKQPYLMRFLRREYDGKYEAVAAHKIEAMESDDADALPPINSSMLVGVPPCPYCEREAAAMCACGSIFCDDPNSTAPCQCPHCNAMLSTSSGGSFDIQRSQG